MDDPYDPLRASLVTLLGVIAFISSRSFQWSIVLSLEFQCVSNISFFLLSSLSYLYCKLYKAILPFKKIPYDAYDSQIVDVICDSLNKVISLNIFWPYYFNLFYHAKNNKKKNSLLTLALAHSNVRVLVKPIF
jgi:hypothetical protein